jgi:hypothetical protein
MRALRAEGLGYDRIADLLNAEGLRPRTGAQWWGKTVNNILAQTEPSAANNRARSLPEKK